METLKNANTQAIDRVIERSRWVMKNFIKGERLSIVDLLFDTLYISTSYESYLKMEEPLLKATLTYLNRSVTSHPTIAVRASAALTLAALYAAAAKRHIKFE